MSEPASTAQFLSDLTSRGVHLWVEGEGLRYRAPQNAITPALRTEIGRRKTELVDLLQRRREMAPRSAAARIVPDPASRHEPFPLTDIQQAYWVGRDPAFELGLSAQLYSEREVDGLDLGRFVRAWRRLLVQHEMLRVSFLPDGRQRIVERLAFTPPVIDLRGLAGEPAAGALARLREHMKRHGPPLAARPFELVVSLRDGGLVHLHLTLSLLVCDGMSSDVLFRDLLALYEDPDRPLPRLDLSFRDYVMAVAGAEGTETYRRSLAAWRQRLPTLPPAPELPLARPPAALRGHRFVRRTHRLPPATWRSLKERSLEHGLTAASAVCAAYAEVLAAWSKSRHFLLNLLFFSRPLLHPQINEVVGNFSTTILLEVDASAAGSFAARAERLQRQLWADIEHAAVSGIRVLRELTQQRREDVRPVVPVVFASTLGLSAGVATALSGRAGDERPEYDSMQTPQVWIDHQVQERDGQLVAVWDTVDDLFPPGLVQEMFDAYCRLLERLADDAAAWAADDLDLLPAAQRARRDAVNATAGPVPDELLHAPFLRQAARHPERLAAICGDRTLTYGELRRRAGRLAGRLRRAGAGPGRLVAVCMHKGWEQVVAVLGVLESGAAYLPIAADLPLERRRFLLDHGQVRIVLLQEGGPAGEPGWPAETALLTVRWDEGPDEPGAEPPPAPARPGDLAYVIYTSGSTGLPKGVMIDHRGALNTVLDINRRWRVGPGDRVLALSSLSFDLSVYDLFGLLAAGGTVVLPAPSAAGEPGHWLDLCRRHGVTLWSSVPALMEMLIDHVAGRAEQLPAALRLVLLSGDWIPVTLPGRLREVQPAAELISLGGATEASIWSIAYPVGEVDRGWKSIPYGRPLTNQAFHVLDERLADCPDWVTGQLFIAGVGLALGYLHDPQKTAASFLHRPRTGERIYRTGDLGRYLPSGDLEILGREDLQVKIQGYRIELGEVEAALLAQPEVRAAAAVAVGEARASKRLVGYVVPAAERPGLLEELREALAARLPPYMVPAHLVLLPELPLSANGKVDRAALARPQAEERAGREHVPPRSGLESLLAEIWSAALGVPSVGARDHFFELGGQSLLAVRTMNEIRRRTGRDLPLSALFEAPTVEQLAALIAREEAAERRSPLVAIQAAGARPPFFCIHPVGGNVLCYVELARHLGPDQPFYGLQSVDAAGTSIEELAAVYLAAVRERAPHGPYFLGGWSMGGVVAFEMARQLVGDGEEVAALVLLDAARPRPGAGVDDAALACRFARDFGGLLGRELTVETEALRALPREEWLRHILTAAGPAGAGIGVEQARSMLATFTRNYRALLDYHALPYPGRLALLRAVGSPHDAMPEPSLGWSEVAGAGVLVETVPGDHYSMVRPPHVAALARILGRCLAPADGALRREAGALPAVSKTSPACTLQEETGERDARSILLGDSAHRTKGEK